VVYPECYAIGTEARMTPQQKYQQKLQDKGWKRLSVFLPPEYIAKAKAAADYHGGLAEAVRAWLDAEAGEAAPSPAPASPGTGTPQ